MKPLIKSRHPLRGGWQWVVRRTFSVQVFGGKDVEEVVIREGENLKVHGLSTISFNGQTFLLRGWEGWREFSCPRVPSYQLRTKKVVEAVHTLQQRSAFELMLPKRRIRVCRGHRKVLALKIEGLIGIFDFYENQPPAYLNQASFEYFQRCRIFAPIEQPSLPDIYSPILQFSPGDLQ